MASTIYYGKSETERNVSVKKVVMEEIPNFQPGDILSVYFKEGNLVDYPTLIIGNKDSSQSNIISNDTGLSIYTPGQGSNAIGTWTDGEVVNFSYTEKINNVFGWEIIGKSIATDTIYGGVLLNGTGDNESKSAISVDAAKRLLSAAAVGNIHYENRQSGSGATEIGDLTLTTYNPITGETDVQTATISVPHNPDFPGNVGAFENDMGYISESSAAVTEGILFKSENNSNDVLKVEVDDNSSVVIDLNNNGNLTLAPIDGNTIINSGLTVNGAISGTFNATAPSTIPNLTVDTINVTSNGNGLSVSGNTHLQGNTIIDSLNIGDTPLSSYVYDKIDDEFLSQAYRIFKASGNQHIKWQWIYSKGYDIAPNETAKIYVGDASIVGYRTVGIISWRCYNTTYAGYANLCGFYWLTEDPDGHPSHTGVYDCLYAEVCNIGSKSLTQLRVQALVLLMRDDPFSIINMPIRFTRVMTEDEETYEIDKLNGTVSSTGELSFNIDNICDDWDTEGYPTIIYINNTPITGENVDNFMNDIYTVLYQVNDNTRPLNQKVSTTINYNDVDYKLSCYLSNPIACWLRVTTV